MFTIIGYKLFVDVTYVATDRLMVHYDKEHVSVFRHHDNKTAWYVINKLK